jgi:hypothetical protein
MSAPLATAVPRLRLPFCNQEDEDGCPHKNKNPGTKPGNVVSDPNGVRTFPENTGYLENHEEGGARGGAVGAAGPESAAELQTIVDAWHVLPEDVRQALYKIAKWESRKPE